MKRSSNKSSGTTFNASSTRRQFIKRTDGTVLLFGIGVPSALAKECVPSGPNCNPVAVVAQQGGVNNSKYCSEAGAANGQNCTVYDVEICAQGNNVKQFVIPRVGRRWCVW